MNQQKSVKLQNRGRKLKNCVSCYGAHLWCAFKFNHQPADFHHNKRPEKCTRAKTKPHIEVTRDQAHYRWQKHGLSTYWVF